MNSHRIVFGLESQVQRCDLAQCITVRSSLLSLPGQYRCELLLPNLHLGALISLGSVLDKLDGFAVAANDCQQRHC